MESETSPESLEAHRHWVDKLVNTTPTPSKPQHFLERPALTEADSPTEHVLRGSKSFAARSWKSRTSANSLRVPSNKENRSTTASDPDRHPSGHTAPHTAPALGEIAPNNQILRPGPFRPRPSPTPSLRRKKIESLVKAHGSPTHVRVTAGGRIVPSEQSPLCHPRYGYSAIKTNGGLIKFAPNHPMGNAQWTHATENGFVAQDINGRFCQIVDGTILPLDEVDGALRLFMQAPNLNITQRNSSLSRIPGRFGPSGNPQQRQPSRVIPPEPSASAQINALELEYSKLDHELKDVDKTEVLHGRTMGKAARDALIGKRRELVMTLDNVRKALKSIKQQAPANAPISPRVMQNMPSPSKTRLPAFLQQRQRNQEIAMPPPPPAWYGQPYVPGQAPPFPPPYGFQPTPSPDAAFGGQPWAMPPPAMFAPPPPFDGSVSSMSLPFPEPFHTAVPCEQRSPPAPIVPKEAPTAEQRIPQSDGSRSMADLQKVASPRQSHALPIKVPEQKGLKSSLNPMSPVYKPGNRLLKDDKEDSKPSAMSAKDRVPTPLPILQHLPPPGAGPLRVVNTTDEAISPTKKSTLVHSSSIASFETADFFPRNTREYSTRKHAYPAAAESLEDKENADPQRRDSKQDRTPVMPEVETQVSHSHPVIVQSSSKPTSPQTGRFKEPSAPPGTPVDPETVASRRRMPLKIDGTAWERHSHGIDADIIPDREAHNLSPKIKRCDWLFVEEHPDRTVSQASSSPEKFHACQDELCVTSSPYDDVDFGKKPREFIEGYQSGLNRNPPGFDRSTDFIEGYCAALMKTKAPCGNVGASTGSPVKPASRRPSPVSTQPRSSSGLQLDRRPVRPALQPLETHMQSMDTLKQAVFAPQNENAILTPAADGPHVNEPPFNLGAWAKGRDSTASANTDPTAVANALHGFQFPQRTSSVLKRQINILEDHLGPNDETSTLGRGHDASQGSDVPLLQASRSGNETFQPPGSPLMSAKSIPSSSLASVAARIGSMTSIDSNVQRNWPGHRVFSPHLEWKSPISVAHNAGLASGFFAQAQYDGASDRVSAGDCHGPQLTDVYLTAGALGSQAQRPESIMSNNTAQQHRSRFKEGSLDGITNPPNSPQPTSPPMSPNISPNKVKTRDSPGKGSSPARAKFEHIAERVGIKVVNGKEKEATGESVSPSGKRRWRDVWRGGSRKESSVHEGS